MYGLNDKELQQIKDVVVSCGVTRCILFGSYAKGCAKKGRGSDPLYKFYSKK
jgi:predicted nucleotidyltransferase